MDSSIKIPEVSHMHVTGQAVLRRSLRSVGASRVTMARSRSSIASSERALAGSAPKQSR